MADVYGFASFPTFRGVDAVRVEGLESVGADIVEESAPYDGPGQITVSPANRVVPEILNGMAERKAGIV